MNNIVKDISTLTTVPEKTLNKMVEKIVMSICEDARETQLEGKSIVELDIGIGTLYIGIEDLNAIKYKFIPNDDLIKNVQLTLKGKLNLMEGTLNTAIAQAFENV